MDRVKNGLAELPMQNYSATRKIPFEEWLAEKTYLQPVMDS
jgi:hypothetical protein